MTIDLREPEPCPVCHGSGSERIETRLPHNDALTVYYTTCKACNGTGDKNDE